MPKNQPFLDTRNEELTNLIGAWFCPRLQLFVKPLFFHVKERFLWHEMPHIAAFFNALADEGGRNLQNRGFQHRNRGVINKIAAIVTLTGKDQKLVVVEDFLVFAPMLQVLQAVHAADENELTIRVLFREFG